MTSRALLFSFKIHVSRSALSSPPITTTENVCKIPPKFKRTMALISCRVAVAVDSPEIARASLHASLSVWAHIYATPCLALYPLLAYAYFVRYDDWLGSEEWTFLACVTLGLGHALSFLATRWSTGVRAFVTCRSVNDVRNADCIRIVPAEHRGKGEIVRLRKKDVRA